MICYCKQGSSDSRHPFELLITSTTCIMSESTKNLAKKPRRSHSFGGCDTCRRRHVKCDQVRPHCLTCKAVGVECAGYPKDLKWVTSFNASSADPETRSASRPLSSRRHLYSGNYPHVFCSAFTLTKYFQRNRGFP